MPAEPLPGRYDVNPQTEAFLDLFIATERVLRQMAGGREEGFGRLLHRVRERSAVVRRWEQELRAFNELRNLLVHQPLPSPLADPTPETVETLRFIYRQLTEPQPVLPRFAREVYTLDADQTFGDAVEAMHRTGYSQFPVYRQRHFVGLLTDGILARWMVAHLDRDFSQLLPVPLARVLQQTPRQATVAFVGRKATVPEVREMFEQHIRHGQLRLDAVIITEHGQPDEQPLGIVTPTDAVALAAEEARALPARTDDYRTRR